MALVTVVLVLAGLYVSTLPGHDGVEINAPTVFRARILSQTNDGDRHAVLPSEAAVVVALTFIGRDPQAPLTCNVIDAQGEVYPCEFDGQSKITIFRGYRSGPKDPVLYIQQGTSNIRIPLQPFPPPRTYLSKTTKRDSRVTCRHVREYRPGVTNHLIAHGLEFDLHEVRPGEYPFVSILRSTYLVPYKPVSGSTSARILDDSSRIQAIARNAREVEIEVSFDRRIVTNAEAVFAGLILGAENGWPVVRTKTVTRKLEKFGATMRVTGAGRPHSRPPKGKVSSVEIPVDWTFDVSPKPDVSVSVISPKPEDLGLERLQIAGQILSSIAPPKGPIKYGPFDLKLRMSSEALVETRRFRCTVPVEPGGPIRPFHPPTLPLATGSRLLTVVPKPARN